MRGCILRSDGSKCSDCEKCGGFCTGSSAAGICLSAHTPFEQPAIFFGSINTSLIPWIYPNGICCDVVGIGWPASAGSGVDEGGIEGSELLTAILCILPLFGPSSRDRLAGNLFSS